MSSNLLAHFEIQALIRAFFLKEGFLDVLTPPMVENPGMEVHIHPFQVASAKSREIHDLYLHTSPEFHMKELLSHGLEKIFTMSYCFRDEPHSPHHRHQFIMLEWYRAHTRYEQIMSDCQDLLEFCYDGLKRKKYPVKSDLFSEKMKRVTIQELFLEFLNFDILNYLDPDDLRKKIQLDHKNIPLPECRLDFDDLFFLLYLNEIEPHLAHFKTLLVYEFPYPLAALSTLKASDSRVAERFEIYLNGIELCNCFNELTSIDIQKKRFAEAALDKKRLYNYALPKPSVLYSALERGLPASSGIALGVERLLLGLIDIENPFYK